MGADLWWKDDSEELKNEQNKRQARREEVIAAVQDAAEACGGKERRPLRRMKSREAVASGDSPVAGRPKSASGSRTRARWLHQEQEHRSCEWNEFTLFLPPADSRGLQINSGLQILRRFRFYIIQEDTSAIPTARRQWAHIPVDLKQVPAEC